MTERTGDPEKFAWVNADDIEWDDDEPEDATEADNEQLKNYWIRGEGLARWAEHPHPWGTLFDHLKKHMDDKKARRTASKWFHEVFGIWPGERGGKNPLGKG